MTAIAGPFPLAKTGSTGNNNHASLGPDANADKVAVEFVVEVAGATPTVTYKVQGSFDADRGDGAVADGAANWFDLILLPSDSDTPAVSKTVTAVGVYVAYLTQAQVRFVRRLRLVTSANTNVTYRANLHNHVKP